jgi:GNAT superfamily N-acetyltransferase
MSITLRSFEITSDLERLVELVNLISSEPLTEEILREGYARSPEGAIRHEVVAVDEAGWIAGYGRTGRTPWRTPGEFGFDVIVDRAARNRGIGSMIHDDLLEFARRHGAAVLKSHAREGDDASVAFGQRRGFQIERHVFESVLDVPSFDERRFAGTVEAAEASGIRFFSFADVPGSEADQRALYDLNTLTGRDIPGSDPEETRPFEQFRKDVFEAFWFRPDGQILAADGERWVGLAALGEVRPGVMYNMMTGVIREYRGRGIATALKLLGVDFCRRHGAKYTRTGNDSLNAPMLAVNRKLGYRSEAGFYLLRKELEGS